MYISQNTVFIPLISLFLFDHYSAKILLLQDKTIQEINNLDKLGELASEYVDRVKNATTLEDIQRILEEAQAKNNGTESGEETNNNQSETGEQTNNNESGEETNTNQSQSESQTNNIDEATALKGDDNDSSNGNGTTIAIAVSVTLVVVIAAVIVVIVIIMKKKKHPRVEGSDADYSHFE